MFRKKIILKVQRAWHQETGALIRQMYSDEKSMLGMRWGFSTKSSTWTLGNFGFSQQREERTNSEC